MSNLVDISNEQLSQNAYAKFSAELLFTEDQLKEMEYLVDVVPKEKVLIGDVGDDNCLLVGRFMQDKKNELPIISNGDMGKKMLSILNSSNVKNYFDSLINTDSYIRRCQANILTEGSHIGVHIDTYSNMDYIYSVVVQFGKDYEGGEFFVHYNNNEHSIKTTYHDVLINKCEIPHGVKKVLGGNRKSLVFFVSDAPLTKYNEDNHQI